MKKTINATRIFSFIFAAVMAFSCVCTYAPIKAEAATLAQQKQNIENKLIADLHKVLCDKSLFFQDIAEQNQQYNRGDCIDRRNQNNTHNVTNCCSRYRKHTPFRKSESR